MSDPSLEAWRRADALLSAALDRPAAERRAFVEREAGADAALAARVLRALSAAEDEGGDDRLRPGAGLVGIADEVTADWAGAAPLAPGQTIGRYRIVDELGRGGMSAVYLALRSADGFEQRVALKMLLESHAGLAPRLARERRILAAATHPDIARLLDGGIDEAGRPYLVMELVDGEPIDAWCDARRVSLRERLRLFVRVARAVHHAHRALVVHRDIKPSNVLVTAEGHPKLLDFGIAKILDETDDPDLTRTGARPLTPAYASPEQLRAQPVTTASDVYQLGVLLYLLATGARPYRAEPTTSPLDLARAICDEPPVPPASHFATAGHAPEAAAWARRATRARLQRILAGDLGTILQMALRKEPERRYASAAELADDLERYLAGRTVRARPDTVAYRTVRFVRRHAVATALGVLLVGAVAAFAAASALQAARLVAERDRAQRAAEIADASVAFLTDVFDASDPAFTRGQEIGARDVLDRGAEKLATSLEEDTLVRVRLQRAVGRAYEKLGEHLRARPLYAEAHAGARRLAGDDAPETIDAAFDLARAELRAGHYAEAETLLQHVIEARRRDRGAEHADTLAALGNLGALRLLQGRYAEAETLLRDALEVRRRVQGEDHPDTLSALNNFGSFLMTRGRLDEAIATWERALAGRRRGQGPDHPETLTAASNLAQALLKAGRAAEAEALLADTLERRRRVLGPRHPAVFNTMNSIAALHEGQGRWEEAERERRLVLEGRREVLGPTHPLTFDAMMAVGEVREQRGDRREAEALFRAAHAGLTETLGAGHPAVADAAEALARVRAGASR